MTKSVVLRYATVLRSSTPRTSRRLFSILASVISLGPTTTLSAADSPVASFYVSVSGNDTNAGSETSPFLTLERARDAMRASATKTTHIGPGSYARATPLVLTRADDGETWLGGGAAEFDGGGAVSDMFLVLGGSHITIDGFRIHNVRYRGVGIHGGAAFSDDPVFNVTTGPAVGNTVQNTEVSDISAPYGAEKDYSYWNSGGVVAEGVVPGTRIVRNYFHDTNSMGMRVAAERPGDDMSGSSIDSNIVANSMQVVSDGGAIYLQDVVLHSVDIAVTHNYIYNFQGPLNDQGRGIYLDQSASNVKVANNIVRAGPRGAEGTAALLVSGGSNNIAQNNIIDLGCSATVIAAAFLMPPSGPNTRMKGNSFEHNLILSNFSGLQDTSFFNQQGYSYYCGGELPPQNVANNAYANLAGGEERTDGNCSSDVAPSHVNVPASRIDYQFSDASFLLDAPINFHPIDAAWGPTGSLPEAIPASCRPIGTFTRPWSRHLLRGLIRRLIGWP